MRDAFKARQSRTNEKRKKTLGRRVLVFQRDVVDVSDENEISGAFEKRKEELFAARTTKASDGGQRVPQTISKEDGRKIEEETGSRERLLRRGRRKTSAAAAAAQNVKWNASAFAKEPKEYEEGISWKRSRRKRSDGGVGGRMKDYFDAVNEDATSSQQFYIVLEEGEGRADTKRAEQISVSYTHLTLPTKA